MGIQTAWANGADVLSNSWGGGAPADIVDFAIHQAKTEGRGGLGCVVVFSSGNADGPVSYPATLSEVVAVGATNQFDERCDVEDWGYDLDGNPQGSNYGPEIDVAAPGVNIFTTDITGAGGYNSGGNPADADYFGSFAGTSAAAPFVSGLAALVLSRNPTLTSDQVQAAIENHALDLGNPGHDDFFGSGRIDAYATLSAVAGYVPVFGGTITGETTWRGNQVYYIQDTLTIAAGARVTVEPGCIVKFRVTSSRIRLVVNGTLDIQGTGASRAVFTSERDDAYGGDTNGDGGASSPAPGDWGYIEYNSGGNVLDWCRIRYAGLVSGAAYVVRCNTGDVVIENNVFEQKYVERNWPLIQMSYSNGAQSPVIRNNSLDNGSFLGVPAIRRHNPLLATVPVIEGNSGAGDGEYGILCQSTAGGPMSPRISSNHLTGTGSGRGVQVIDAESASFLIQGNQLGLYDYGLVLQSVPAGSLVIGNMITGCDDGIYLDSSSPTVMNTTLVNLLRYPIVEVNTCLPQYSGTTLTGTSHTRGSASAGRCRPTRYGATSKAGAILTS